MEKFTNKKFLALFFSLAVLLTVIPFVSLSANDTPFSDVKSSDYYAEAAKVLAQKGVLQGYPDGTFRAGNNITRAEMAAIIIRALGKEAEANAVKANDTRYMDVVHWANGYITIATNLRIIEGDGNGRFRPNDNVKFEEAVKIVVSAAGWGDQAIAAGGWPDGYIKVAKEKGVLNNVPGSKGAASTRGAVALMVYQGLPSQFLEKKPERILGGSYKIAIYTNTLDQNEEEYRSAERAMKMYGADKIIHQTMPVNFAREWETLIANGLALVGDPDVTALIMNQAVQGATATFEKIRAIRPDVLLFALTPAENDTISSVCDFAMQPNELAMGKSIPAQAKKLGAKTFVHYSFPRHMSYPILAKRRDLMIEYCRANGMEFVDATAPDPTGDAGIPGAQQFMLEDIPRKVAEYGKDINFFATNCAMQEPLIRAAVEQKAIVAQQCCPSPFHGYPGALAIEVPENKAGDVNFMVSAIKEKIAAKGCTGRFSTWAAPISMVMCAAAVEYAIGYSEGAITERSNLNDLKTCFNKALTDFGYTGLKMEYEQYEDYRNYILLLCDYITF